MWNVKCSFKGDWKNRSICFFNFLLGSLQIVLNVVFIAVLKLGLQGYVVGLNFSTINCCYDFVLKIKLWKFINIKCVEISLAKEMIVYSFPLIPNKVSWTIINLSDRIILMNMIGSEATGLYAVSYKFPNLMDTVYGFFLPVLERKLS